MEYVKDRGILTKKQIKTIRSEIADGLTHVDDSKPDELKNKLINHILEYRIQKDRMHLLRDDEVEG